MDIDWNRVSDVVSDVIDNQPNGDRKDHNQITRPSSTDNETRGIVDDIIEAFNRSGYE